MRAIIWLLISIITGVWASAQQDEIKELEKQIQQLKQEIQELKQKLDYVEDQEIIRLEELLEKKCREIEEKTNTLARHISPIIFNPRLTAFVNSAVRIDSKKVEVENVFIHDKAFLRSFEIDIRGAIDPYAEAVAIASFDYALEEEGHFHLGEAYALIKRLPIIEEAPLGCKLKVGKFRAPIGTNNLLHLHDLPWSTRPLPVIKYLAVEINEFFCAGYAPVGLDMQFFLPKLFLQVTSELNVAFVQAGEMAVSQDEGGKHGAYYSRLTNSLYLDDKQEHFLTAGLSKYAEPGIPYTYLYGLDLTYKYRPAEKGQWRSVVAGAEFFYVSNKLQIDQDVVRYSPVGWFAYIQYQPSWPIYAGIRYDWVEEPTDQGIETKAWSLFVSYYTSEFLRFRVGAEYRKSDIKQHDGLCTFMLEVNAVFGSHPVEPYWVHR